MIKSAEEFVLLRTSDQPEQYQRAIQEAASYEVWLEVIEKYPDMKQWVILNKTVPLSILEILATDSSPLVRWTVAIKRKASIDILEKLAHDEDVSVRIRVARNPKTPITVLDFLANDAYVAVSEAAKQSKLSRIVANS